MSELKSVSTIDDTGITPKQPNFLQRSANWWKDASGMERFLAFIIAAIVTMSAADLAIYGPVIVHGLLFLGSYVVSAFTEAGRLLYTLTHLPHALRVGWDNFWHYVGKSIMYHWRKTAKWHI